MKKIYILFLFVSAFWTMSGQWVNDPVNNTMIASCATGAAEIYVATDNASGDTYVQWHYGADNGWSPWLQRLNSEGVPQWDISGIHITTPNLATWSPGYAMTPVDGGVVSMFRTADAKHWVVKINTDGSFPWGEHGITLFDGQGGGRSEILAGDDGGVWTLGTDMDNSFLQYVYADGTLGPVITISDPTKKCSNGILIPANDGVFVVYAKQTIQSYTNYEKELYVAGYNKEGEQISAETQLMSPQTIGASYVHYAISDGIGGGYVYTWHAALGDAYNTYVFHFNENGASTITDLNGIPVHTTDPNNYYINASTTIDPETNDLIIAYRQTDAGSETQDMVWINRITSSGYKVWDDGIAITETIGDYSDIKADAFEYGGGFSVIYKNQETVEAAGYDMDGNVIWNTIMSSSGYEKTVSENTTGFHLGQNIIAWVNASSGNLYGQNIGYDGSMGDIEPPTPPTPCYAPTDLQGECYYDPNLQAGGALISWSAPEQLPLYYNLYKEETKEVIEIDANATSYFDESEPGDFVYRLTAVYEDCESDYALTPNGNDYLLIFVTSVPEYDDEEIIHLMNIYTITGQLIKDTAINQLPCGVYIIQGITKNGKMIQKKIAID